jgi:hypothetical protein
MRTRRERAEWRLREKVADNQTSTYDAIIIVRGVLC